MMLASKSASHPLQPVQQRVALGARRAGAHARQVVAGFVSFAGIGDEFLVGALGANEAGLVVARGHVGRPEQVFLGLVDCDIGVVQVVEVLSRALHVGDRIASAVSRPDSRGWQSAPNGSEIFGQRQRFRETLTHPGMKHQHRVLGLLAVLSVITYLDQWTVQWR